jgi:hypothetical protein
MLPFTIACLRANHQSQANVVPANDTAGTTVLEAKMRIFWAAAAAAILLCGAARAGAPEGPQVPTSGDAAVGVGVICNTPDEAKQFVDLRSHGAAADQAVQAVNANARDERACGVAAVAYVHDGTVSTVKLENTLVQIVRINVVAGFNGSGWQRVAGMVQYAVLEGAGESI